MRKVSSPTRTRLVHSSEMTLSSHSEDEVLSGKWTENSTVTSKDKNRFCTSKKFIAPDRAGALTFVYPRNFYSF